MERRPLESIMATTMESIRDMVDVNTVVGEPVTAFDGTTIIPISRVSFGFVAGGGDCDLSKGKHLPGAPTVDDPPFSGGSAAGVTIHPMGFLVVSEQTVRLLPAQYHSPLDRLIEMLPQMASDFKNWIGDETEPPNKPQNNGEPPCANA